MVQLRKFAVNINKLTVTRHGHGGMGVLGGLGLRGQPDPQAPIAHVEHAKNANDEEEAAQVHHLLSRCAGHLEDAGLHLVKVLQHKGGRGWVVLGIAQGKHRLGHKALGFRSDLQRGKLRLAAQLLGQLKQDAVQNAQQHFAGAFALRLGDAVFEVFAQCLQAAVGFFAVTGAGVQNGNAQG